MLNVSRAAAATLGIVAGACVAAVATPADRQWTIDPVHSTAGFTVTHLGITKVNGTIPIETGVVVTQGDRDVPERVDAKLDVAGIDTRNGMRDGDLKSDHWFDVAAYPTIAFESTKITAIDARRFDVSGRFTMHGVTRPLTLHAAFSGRAKGLKGEPRIAYEATGQLERSDYGMTGGGPIVGNDVALTLDVEAAGSNP